MDFLLGKFVDQSAILSRRNETVATKLKCHRSAYLRGGIDFKEKSRDKIPRNQEAVRFLYRVYIQYRHGKNRAGIN